MTPEIADGGAHAAGDRLRELAQERAAEKHDMFRGFSLGHYGNFSTCPQSDCRLVRDLVPVPPQPDVSWIAKFISDWQWESGCGSTLFNGGYHERRDALHHFAADILAAAAKRSSGTVPPAPSGAPTREVQIRLRTPFAISGRLGIGAESWAELLEVEKRGIAHRNIDSSGVSVGWRTFQSVMNALRHCGEKHYLNPDGGVAAPAPSAPICDPCRISVSSRICEYGTLGCDIKHQTPGYNEITLTSGGVAPSAPPPETPT